MPKYLVKSRIKHDGEYYEPGDVIELSKKAAAAMPNAVELPKPEGKRAEDDATGEVLGDMKGALGDGPGK